MDDSSVSDAHENILASSVASLLGVKGGLRFRAHGSTQKAHIVLRRVTVSDDSSDDETGSKVVRFTLIAHKRIEVKPGKELLLMLESDDGPFKDRPVVMEGDLAPSGYASEEEESTQVAEEEEVVFVPPIEEAIPPKMRRAWTRKADDSVFRAWLVYCICTLKLQLVRPAPLGKPAVTSVGVQTEPSYVSKTTQAQLLCEDASSQTFTSSNSVSVQVDLSPGVKGLTAPQDGAIQRGQTGTDNRMEQIAATPSPTTANGVRESDILTDGKIERSLSPMELDSPPDSPQLSPLIIGSIPPTSVPEAAPSSPHSPLYSPSASIASSSGVQDMQMSPIELKSAGNSKDVPSDGSLSPLPLNGLHAGPSKTPSSSSDTSTMPLSARISSPKDVKQSTKPPARSVKPPVTNPFVSGGFVTDFAATLEKAERANKSPPKIKLETSENELSGKSTMVKPEPSTPAPATSQPIKGGASRSIVQNAVASSSKVQLSKVPTRPQHFMRMLSGRALEKSPEAHNGLNEDVKSSNKSPPPDPKSLVYIPSGPTSNPLGIRPSVSTVNNIQRSIPKIPSVPKTPTPSTSTAAKKRLLVGTEWRPFVKATHVTGPAGDIPHSTPTPSPAPPPTPTPTVPSMLSQVVSYSSPSPPLAAPPPLPSSAPQNKWKRVNTDIPPSPTTTSASVPATPCPPKIDAKEKEGRPMSRLLEKAQATIPSSTPSGSSPAASTSISPTLTHPLPPKPVLASRSIKRERPKSPEPISRKRQKRIFRWPTVDSHYSTRLLGEGQLGIRNIAFCSDGSHFALSCNDRTIRIWNSRNRIEIARLSHNSPVVAVAWMDGDSGVVSLAEDGMVSKWTRSGLNHWQWAKVLDAGNNERRTDEDQICLAYIRDRIAVSYPRVGVKVWIWLKGTWQGQRSILRQNVTAIKFVDDGAAIIGGTRDGVLYALIQSLSLFRVLSVDQMAFRDTQRHPTRLCLPFVQSELMAFVPSHTLDVTPSGSHALVGLGSSAFLVGMRRPDNKGVVEQSFTCKETEVRGSQVGTSFGAVFATEGQAVLFGSVEGCVLVWDRKKAVIVYGLEHEEDDTIQAVASFNGPTNRDGYLVTGTKSGQLSWWSQPVAAVQ
ncbi:hypothetical protein DXG01_008838 [Tephrocybe rancida]|nr:hypothetical protein DXG01_008838 [Tephrocybe rancida]